MAPISWLSLFIIFSMTFLLFSMMNYYSFLPPSPQNEEKSHKFKCFPWKW